MPPPKRESEEEDSDDAELAKMFGKPSDNKKIAVAQSDSSDDEPKKNQAPAKKGP